MTQVGIKPGVKLSPKRFTPVYTSRYGKVRIFKIFNISKESKRWVANPKNRVCDAPGSWYCPGQYPPALKPLIAKRKAFSQREDFNKAKDEDSENYVNEYHKRMSGDHSGSKKSKKGKKKTSKTKKKSKKSGGSKAEKAAKKKRNEFLDGLRSRVEKVGCYGAESAFFDREYQGGVAGANIDIALDLAIDAGKKYFALARSGTDGHLFTFDKKPKGSRIFDEGCKKSCVDAPSFMCGCADALCGNVKPAKGEEHVRRWVVYKVKAGAKKSENTMKDDL